MSDAMDPKNKMNNIRARAEAKMKKMGIEIPQMSHEETSRLIFELQTHQIELEMQNEELLQAQIDLADSRDRFSDLYDFAPVGYVTTDVKGNVLETNLTFCQQLGQPKNIILESPLSSFVHPEDQDQIFAHFRGISESKRRTSSPLKLNTHEQPPTWVEIETVRVQPNQSGVTCFRSVINDVSKRVYANKEKIELEQQLHHAQKLESLGVLAGGMAHNFNNLLVPILGYAELVHLKLDATSKEARQVLLIKDSAMQAKSLVEQILVFGQKGLINSQCIQVEALVLQALDLVKPSIPTQVELKYQFETEVLPIAADPGQIQQVLINLFLNAVQSMTGQGGEISINLESLPQYDFVSTKSGPQSGAYLHLSIQDTGSGIDPKNIKQIFDPFFTTKDRSSYRGVGLGLTTVSRIIEQHGGNIEVNSIPKEGTTFHLYFPAVSGEELAAPSSAHIPSSGHNGKILFIDDDPMVREMWAAFLNKLGYQFSSFGDPHEALKTFSDHPHDYQLVLTDYTMPHLSGDRVARRIKGIRPDIPVLLSTGYTNLATDENLQKWGCDGIILKPFSLEELESTLKMLLLPRT